MNTRLLLAACAFVIFTAAPSQAAPKNRAKADNDVPSAQLERLLTPCLEAILAPLQKDPKMPRVEVETLRSTFAGGQIKAVTPAQQQIYQNAMNVCTALTTAMDDRAKSKSDALASAKLPSISNGSGIIKSSPVRGADAGANAQAIRQKQQDERKYADKLAHQQSAFIETGAYKAWTEKAARLRQNVMALYTRQIQLEALDERNVAAAAQATKAASPAAKPATSPGKPAPAAAPEIVKNDPAKESPYFGKWHARADGRTYLVNEDHTVVRLAGNGAGEVKGSWDLTATGVFVVSMDDGVGGIRHMKLSEDGKSMHSGTGARWNRLQSAEK